MKAIVFFDTSRRDEVCVSLQKKERTTVCRKGKAQDLLSIFSEVLQKTKTTLSDISEIYVHTGPGSFTGLRIGCAVANTLGYALDIPVNGENVTRHPAIPVYEKKEEK
ncbi:MAG TPA: tRNA (adenosine(37)-N6)-threonylcarbamoyltransferase complex dimerization subunit type 1 TsaB [Patescibacteria group bacterium]|nr:tRNA (adenosine(37)-N6)-threonylcarbamoyltransferase complex dimerization subunit type 1 TsaB [Patescibacteria group bacterium]